MRPNPEPNIILPAGSKLFHGTIEPLEGAMRTGGDQVLWFADSPAIAQLYIPRSGLMTVAQSSNIALPSKNEEIQAIQDKIGLHFDLDEVTWDPIDRPKSYLLPEDWNRDHRDRTRAVEERLEALGYEGEGRPGWRSYRFHFHDDVLLPPGGVAEGTLCVATPLRDMQLYPRATGEGSLMDPQHLEWGLFEKVRASGYDGIMIDDYAQSEKWGNLGHLSVGLFSEAIEDVEWVECVPATYEEYDRDHRTKAYPQGHEPYFARLIGLRNNPRRIPLKRKLMQF